MNGILGWVGRQAPDVAATTRRFPFAIFLLALGTVFALWLIGDGSLAHEDLVARLAAGLFTGAIFAVGGQLFAESGVGPRWLALLLAWAVPIAMLPALQVEATGWLVSPMLPFVAVLWVSVAGFTRIGSDAERPANENRFWWINHRAVTTAAVAIVGFLIVALGLVAIERSLAILFGLRLNDIVYEFILPVAGLFLTPVYWLATVPRLDEYDAEALERPEFLSRAIGFLGEFVLTPLLVVYALILVAYAVQIAVTGEFPNGLLGWMVPVFVVTGAANWLVLHPPFMRRHRIVRLFRRVWYWLTIVPLILFALAVWVRIEAYGLTWERVLLVAGGVWAVLLTAAFLSRRLGDIRLIPALAAVTLIALSVGPWNMLHLSRWHQEQRLVAAMTLANAAAGENPDWSDENAAVARGAVRYLSDSDEGRATLGRVLEERGYGTEPDRSGGHAVLDMLDLPEEFTDGGHAARQLNRPTNAAPVDLTGTPLVHPDLMFHVGSNALETAGLQFALEGMSLLVTRNDTRLAEILLADWLARQQGEMITDPVIEFEVDGVLHRLVVGRASYAISPEETGGGREITFVQATLAYADSE